MARYTKTTATGTVGTSPVVTALEANGDRARLWLYADSQNTGKIYLRWDGVDPTSTAYHVELTAGAGFLLDAAVPAGAVKLVGSDASQRYSIEEA
jgi:hypothetical protein